MACFRFLRRERQLESALTTTQSHAEGCARINVSILKANQFYEVGFVA